MTKELSKTIITRSVKNISNRKGKIPVKVIKYKYLENQFRSVKSTTVTKIRKYFKQLFISIQRMEAITVIR